MFAPGTSATAVLGFKLYMNEVNSNSIPSTLVYNGEAVSNVLKAIVYGLESG
jgi:hypothetical protein